MTTFRHDTFARNTYGDATLLFVADLDASSSLELSFTSGDTSIDGSQFAVELSLQDHLHCLQRGHEAEQNPTASRLFSDTTATLHVYSSGDTASDELVRSVQLDPKKKHCFIDMKVSSPEIITGFANQMHTFKSIGVFISVEAKEEDFQAFDSDCSINLPVGSVSLTFYPQTVEEWFNA